MALVVFLRGVNVGGHRTFQPSQLANALKRFDVVNVGAAGTFVVRGRVSQVQLRADFSRLLPFHTEVMICKSEDIRQLVSSDPFAGQPTAAKITQFVSILGKGGRGSVVAPMNLPANGKWFLKVIEVRERFVLGVYRREMKAIRYLGQLDKMCGATVTTRNWNTMKAIAKILQE